MSNLSTKYYKLTNHTLLLLYFVFRMFKMKNMLKNVFFFVVYVLISHCKTFPLTGFCTFSLLTTALTFSTIRV